MNEQAPKLSHGDLQRRRLEITRGLSRVNWAVLGIVAVVILLALGGLVAAYRASRDANRALTATARAEEELWKSYLAQATAGRLSRAMGCKEAGRQSVTAAARIRPSVELRNEAIAHFALTDLKEGHAQKHPAQMQRLTVDPGFSCLAFTDGSGRVEVRKLLDQQKVLEWRSTNANILWLLFSPDASYLGVGYHEGPIDILDLKTGRVASQAPPFRIFDFSLDGKLFAGSLDAKTLRFLESASGRESRVEMVLPETIKDFAFARGGKRLMLNLDTHLQVVDYETGENLATVASDHPITVLASSERSVAFGDSAGGVCVWDTRSKLALRWIAHKTVVSGLFFNHKGDILVSDSYDGECKLWNPASGNIIVGTKQGFGMMFSLDDKRLGYMVNSSSGGWWGWWDVVAPTGFRSLDFSDETGSGVWAAQFSPDGRMLAVTKNQGVRLVDFPSNRLQAELPMARGRGAWFLPDGKTLLTCGNNRLSLWPLEGSQSNSVRLGQPQDIALPKTAHVDTPLLSYDGRQVSLPLTDSDAALIHLDDPQQPVLFSNAEFPKEPTLSPDGRWLVTGTFHGRGATLWNAATGERLRELAEGNCNPIFSPDGKILVLAGDKENTILESGSWKKRSSIPTGSINDLPGYAAFSRDGHLLAIMKERQLIQLIEPASGKLLAALSAPDPQVINGLSFSWDGSLLAAVSGSAVLIWDLQAIRAALVPLGLDWKSGGSSERDDGPSAMAAASPFSFGATTWVLPAIFAVALVLFCAWIVLRRQRQLISGYLEIDALIEHRNRELEVAHTELMHSQKMKALGTLAAGIAHDFNNLLSIIRMSNQLIGREAKGNREAEENVAEVEKAVQQGKSIVRSMLGYSREDVNGNGNVSLPELIEDTVGLLNRQFLSGITLKLELQPDTAPLRIPRARLEQILLNLVVNAAEAMDGKGNLRIQTQVIADGARCNIRAPGAAANYVELAVADSGCGIPRDILPRIFEPFFTTKTMGANRGTGLGLSMVYTMAEQDNLGIGVDTVLGQGTTFRILIPSSPVKT